MAELRAGANRSTGLVREYTGLTAPAGQSLGTAPILVVDRLGWIRANADGFANVIGPLIDRMNELAKIILADENYFQFPNLRPKDAATLIIIDRSGKVPRVLLGKRHHGHRFMPGKYVFPGGGVEPADARMPFARTLDPHAEARLLRGVKRLG